MEELRIDPLVLPKETPLVAKGFTNAALRFSGEGGDHIDPSFAPKDICGMVAVCGVAEEVYTRSSWAPRSLTSGATP